MRLRILLFFVFSALLIPSTSLATFPDAPHRPLNNVSCADCHADALPPSGRSAICISCHDGSITENPLALAHSAAVIHEGEDPGTWPHGDWGTVCLDCHDPHLHYQFYYVSENISDLFLVTGTIEGITTDTEAGTSTITYSGSTVRDGWHLPPHTDNADWGTKTSPGRGLIFVDDASNPKNTFEILSATDQAITVDEVLSVNLIATLLAPSNTSSFGIIYGQLLKSIIDTPNSGQKTVKFFDPNGGFVDGNDDPAPGGFVDKSNTTIPEGICQVCHTGTTYWKENGTGVLHPANGNINCSDCHPHGLGFKPSCESCHGYPPGTLVFYPDITNSQTAGAHDYHVSVLGFDCDACHKNSAGSGVTHNSNLTVTMGFSVPGGSTLAQGGSYSGQVNVDYDATSTNPITVVTDPGDGTKQCGNLYCHGNYSGSGKNATPVWDNPASGDCGTCHGASNNEPPGLSPDLTDGGHTQHAYNSEPGSESWPRELPCTLCHSGIVSGSVPDSYAVVDYQKHASSFVDWQFDTSDPRLDANASYTIPSGYLEPSDGVVRAYGQCNNVYCHSNVQPSGGVGAPSVYDTPTWGDSKTVFQICVGCHNQEGYTHSEGISTGSHVKHIREYWFGMSSLTFGFAIGPPADPRKCTICHKWNDSFDTGQGRENCDQCHFGGEKQYHVNGYVDIIFDSFAPETATYTNAPIPDESDPGNGYGSCNNLYCHSDGTSVATTVIPANTSAQWGAGSLACDACHANPPAYADTSPKANSHVPHNSWYTCNFCHFTTTENGSTIASTRNHVNKIYDLAGGGTNITFTYSFNTTGGTCSSVSCHGYKNETWGGTGPKLCVDCHLDVNDADDYNFSNNIPARISQNEWETKGHGKSGILDGAGNNACSYCHFTTMTAHFNETGNPFKLVNNTGGSGQNGVCLICHQTDSQGYDPDGGGLLETINSTVKVDSYHYGDGHGSSNNGGRFCWDCHDPHGDANNIRMIHNTVASRSDGIYGIPTVTVATTFVADGTGTDFAIADPGPYTGICNVCHTSTDHYTSLSGDGHHANRVCTDCHHHTGESENDAFTVTCTGCHSNAQDDGDNLPVGGRRAVTGEFPTNNAHAHYGATLENNDCKVCHDQTTHMDGNVDLFDPDNGPNFVFLQPESLTGDPDLSTFCMNCHDADGATRLGTPLDPFGNGNTPPNTAERFSGDLQWDEMQFYEGCEPPGGSLRPVNSHHDISDGDQAFSGAKLECLNCHGAHNAAQSQPVADPNNTSSPWSGSDNAFCLVCHSGGAGPGAPNFPTGVKGPLFSVPAPDPTAGQSCGTNLVYDCAGNCVDATIAQTKQGNNYCDNGKYGYYLWCDAFNNDGDDCGPPCENNNCSTLTGIDTCNYSGSPWWTEYSWSFSPHGLDSKRGWPGYKQTPQVPSYELDCKVCHDPHGSYSATNTAGNPYMIRDTVDGTDFVDDGSKNWARYGWDPNANGGAGDWERYGTAGEVVIPIITDPEIGVGPELEVLCIKCHSDWLNASISHEICGSYPDPWVRPACLFCHSHGGWYDGYDWGYSGSDTICPTP